MNRQKSKSEDNPSRAAAHTEGSGRSITSSDRVFSDRRAPNPLLGVVAQAKRPAEVCQLESVVKNTTQNLPYPDGSGGTAHQVAGQKMDAYLDPKDPLAGSAPGGGAAYALYGALNAVHAVGFIKGHLLNANLGGPGLPGNLFPITGDANKAHSGIVEEVVKGNFLSLHEEPGTGAAGEPNRLHYQVDATWSDSGTGDFLSNPKSKFDCFAEFVDSADTHVAPLVAPTSIVSDPGAVPADRMNEVLGSIGWGSLGSGARSGDDKFEVESVAKAAGGTEYKVKGPHKKVHMTFE